jgi:Fe2+ transport system protein FeoA
MLAVLRTILSGVQWGLVRGGVVVPATHAVPAGQESFRMAAQANTPTTESTACCRRVRLSELRRGETGVIAGADVEAGDAAYLNALGLRREARVRMCSCGDMCIVAPSSCGASRIGLARGLAQQIEVVVG